MGGIEKANSGQATLGEITEEEDDELRAYSFTGCDSL